ncbi:RRXRR domain-containing protein [Myxococcota bacterium]|nr:RRXRR domain-containing protein [Myxococcota bacterium]
MAQNRVLVLDFNHQPLMPCHPARARQLASRERLCGLGVPLEVGSGGQTKYNGSRQGYAKTHWLDAVCVGVSGERVLVEAEQEVPEIKAMGRGSRQKCRMDLFGLRSARLPRVVFPRTGPKTRQKKVHGFQTGDMVKAVIVKGKKAGCYVGRVAVRSSGSFNIKTRNGTTQGISYKHCRILQHTDGYAYTRRHDGVSSPLAHKGVSTPKSR